MAANPIVGLVAPTVRSDAGCEWPLTLQSCRVWAKFCKTTMDRVLRSLGETAVARPTNRPGAQTQKAPSQSRPLAAPYSPIQSHLLRRWSAPRQGAHPQFEPRATKQRDFFTHMRTAGSSPVPVRPRRRTLPPTQQTSVPHGPGRLRPDHPAAQLRTGE
jgi:hypothetical protein